MQPHSDPGPGHQKPGTLSAWLLVIFIFGTLALAIGASVTYSLLHPASWTDRLPVLNASRQPVVLTDYAYASNVSFSELCAFLANDTTEEADYVYPNYTCGDFARRLHDNAEAHGIRCGIVAVTLNTTGYSGVERDNGTPVNPLPGNSGDSGHAFDVFNTTDRGLVYIDATGTTRNEKASGRPAQKMAVYFKEGMPLGEIALNQSESLDYAYYQQREARYSAYVDNVSLFLDDANDFNSEEAAFNTTLNGYYRDAADFKDQFRSYGIELNSTGASNASNLSGNLALWREVLADKLGLLNVRYDAIQNENRTLAAKQQLLDARRDRLKHCEEAKWLMADPMGVVDGVTVYW